MENKIKFRVWKVGKTNKKLKKKNNVKLPKAN